MATESNTKETKIIKVESKKGDAQQEDKPRITVKAAVKTQMRTQGGSKSAPKAKDVKEETATEKPTSSRPPMGRPIINKELENRSRPPMGKPVISKEIVERGMTPEEIEAMRAEEKAAEPKTKKAAKASDDGVKSEDKAAAKKATKETKEAKKNADSEEKKTKTAASTKRAEKEDGNDAEGALKDEKNTKVQKDGKSQSSKSAAVKEDGDVAAKSGEATQGPDSASKPAKSEDAKEKTAAKSGNADEQSGIAVGRKTGGDERTRKSFDSHDSREGREYRGERSDRGSRGDRGDRDNRGERGDRFSRDGERGERGDRFSRDGERSGRGDRPQRSGERGERNDRGDRGQRDGGRGYGNRQFGDRDNRGERGDRISRDGERSGRGDRPQRSGERGDRVDRGGFSKDGERGREQSGRDYSRGGSQTRQGAKSGGTGLDRMETKPNQKNTDKREFHEKERNKFAKLEGGAQGKKNKDKIQQRSLEKQAKPKKHNKPKPVTEEKEDILDTLPTGTVAVTAPITVAGFCEQVGVTTSQVIMALMKLGIMANINQNLDEDTIMVLADELGISVVVAKVEVQEVEEGIEIFDDKEEDLKHRAPIITVMGHVDHGKTSLLDAIRKTNVTASESGGITQHIGASEVNINGQKIVFLDTPGHEAFTAMRARGAHVTDIAVLVVAADDSVKPQTVESISHAKAAGVPIIVAINKIDKPGADPERVKQDLTNYGILVEDWGGDVIAVPVSAKSGEGIVTLLEMILLQAEVLELKANPSRLAMGTVIEARLDKSRGPVATLLVTNGTLKTGMSIVAGTSAGKIRLMTNHKGEEIKKAGPATAVEILGLSDVPEAGDEFNAVKLDKIAKEIAENRKTKQREEILAKNASTTLEQLFSQIQEGEIKDLNLIIKGDVTGSIEAIVSSLEKLNNENVRVKVVHTGVGTVNESDVMLAGTTGSIIIGFNVRPTTAVQTFADRENIQIRLYRVIYDIINDVEDAMKGMLDPEFKEEVLGKAEVRNTFKVPNVGIIAGSYVQEGKVVRNAEIRLVRDGIVIHEGKISSLKRFKDDAKEVNQSYECGIGIESYNDIKEGDIIECFHMVEVERK